MKKFKETLVKKISKTEIDLDSPFYTGDERNEVEVITDNITYSPSMDIDEAINILNELKKSGSNRVYIADHEDHHGYYFYGVKLTELLTSLTDGPL